MRKIVSNGYGINYLIKILQILRDEIASNELAKKSPYTHRGTHYELMKLLVKSHFVVSKKEKIGFKVQKNVIYSLSFDGERFLEFLERLDA